MLCKTEKYTLTYVHYKAEANQESTAVTGMFNKDSQTKRQEQFFCLFLYFYKPEPNLEKTLYFVFPCQQQRDCQNAVLTQHLK
jgi:hypothetical protein